MTDSSTSPRGLKAAQRINQFRFSLQLFQRNYTELKTFIEYMTSSRVAIELGSVDNHWREYEAMREVMFLLHNYVAAAKSLIDHSRVVYRHLYKHQKLILGYQDEVKSRFASNPLSQFIAKLREMSQHYMLPTVSIENTFTPSVEGNTFKSRLKLNTSELMIYDGWNAEAKKYLAKAGKSIDVGQVIACYHDHVLQFHQWFMKEQGKVHSDIPEMVSHLARHGLQSPMPNILTALDENFSKFEGLHPSEVSFSDLEKALSPVLTAADCRLLMLCRYDAEKWMDLALTAIAERFTLPRELRERIREFVAPNND